MASKNKNDKSGLKVNDEIPILKKKVARTADINKDLQKNYTVAAAELDSLRLELSKIRKLIDEEKIELDAAERSRTEIDIQFRHLQEVKKMQDKDVRELLGKHSTLRDALQEHEHKRRQFLEQKRKELNEIEHEKTLLGTQSRFSELKLEDDRRELQSKFFEAKQELKRNFRREVDVLKQHYELELSSVERQTKEEVAHAEVKFNKKIEALQQENYHLRTQLESLKATLNKHEDQIALLESNLKRETTNSEVMGISRVDWLKVDKNQVPEDNREIKALDAKIDELRTKLIQLGEELLLSRRERTAADKQLKDVKHDLDEQEVLHKRLEASKNDSERRLLKRVDQLEEQIARRNKQIESEHTLQKNKLQANVDDRDAEIQALRRELLEVQAQLKVESQSIGKLSTKLSEKTEAERDRYIALEKVKHQIETEALYTKTEVGNMKEKVALLEKEAERYKHQAEASTKELDKLVDKNHQLEQAIKRLENTTKK